MNAFHPITVLDILLIFSWRRKPRSDPCLLSENVTSICPKNSVGIRVALGRIYPKIFTDSSECRFVSYSLATNRWNHLWLKPSSWARKPMTTQGLMTLKNMSDKIKGYFQEKKCGKVCSIRAEMQLTGWDGWALLVLEGAIARKGSDKQCRSSSSRLPGKSAI